MKFPSRCAVFIALCAVWGAISGYAAELISTNAEWRFRKGTNEASTPIDAWRGRTFNDGGWATGRAPFYYDTDSVYTGNTPLPDMRNGYTSVFLRRSFVVPDISAVSTLGLRFFCDDGFALWINGTIVTNHNKADSNFAYNSTATANATEPLQWFGYTLRNPQGYLVNGTNVLAIQAFNRPITSSDFVITVELTAAPRDAQAPTLISVDPPAGTVGRLTQISVTFSEPIIGIGFSDLLVNGSPALGVSGSGANYVFDIAQPPYGPVNITWDPGAAISDFAEPPNAFNTTAANATWSYDLVDTTAPTIVGLTPAPGNTVRSLTQIEVTFSETVTGVDAADLLVNGVGATNVSGSLGGPYVFRFGAVPPGPVRIAWSAGHGIRDNASNAFADGAWTYTVHPDFTFEPIRINEFLTAYSGDVGLKDEDDEVSDWIELHNRGTNSVNLRGWALTDDRDEPGKWTFPDVILGPGRFLVVFASGKDRKPTTAGAKLHTNFKLNSDGEYLALFNAESPRQLASEFAPEFPEQRSDFSCGYDPADSLRYFAQPTPGAANGNSTIAGVVPPVHFNVERGFFEFPFTLVLSTPVAGAEIRFTTDGNLPTATTGQRYSGPLNIAGNTFLRAAAFKPGQLPSKVATHTFLFHQQVLRQPNNPPGLPPVWIDTQNRSWTADYEMDPEIVNDAQYRDLIVDGLKSLPVISLVTKPADMFDNATGIYPKSQARGVSWERPASVEFIFPDRNLQIDCGVQMQGNSVRDPQKTGKHAFRVVFKGDYGPAKLQTRVFPDSALAEFDTLTLRADFNNSWMHWNGAQRPRGQRVRDAFIKDSQRAMSGFSAHNRFFHLYVNGLYWGVYDPVERPDAAFGASYLGGSKEDYDVVNEGQLVDGNMTAYNTMIGISNLAANSEYDRMKHFLDVPHHIDYMLLHFYIGHEDWGLNKNWYTLRRRAPGEGFKYIAWDGELTLNAPTQNRVISTDTASGLHTKLVANAEYRLNFADRVHRHLFNGGALTPDAVAARYSKRASEVDLAMIAESARWGDYRRDVHPYSSGPYELYTRNGHFLTERNRLLTQYFPGRTATVLSQLRAAGLYPQINAPVFSQHGGRVQAGFLLSMTAPSGTIYYTLDGTDPRVTYTGAIAAGARSYTAPLALNGTVVVKARVRSGTDWSALTEAAFEIGSLGIPLRITELMYNPQGGDPYEFVELQNTGATALDVSGFSFDRITYVFPPDSILAPSQVIVLASALSPSSFAARYPGVVVFGYFEDSLANAGERLTLLDEKLRTIVSVDFDDENGWVAAADGQGPSLEIVDPLGDPDAPANWRASSTSRGSPGVVAAASGPGSIRLNEIMADNRGAVTNGSRVPDWIELHNSGSTIVDLDGWSLTDDSNARAFVFAPGTTIAAGEYLVVWCDSDFASPGIHSGFALGRLGETVSLFDPQTNRVDAATFGIQLPNLTVGRAGPTGTWQLCAPTPKAPNAPEPLAAAGSFAINEWLADSLPGASDWIELHNRDASRPAALYGMYLTTSNATLRIQSLSFVSAGGFVQLLADERAGAEHIDFKLPADGGTIALHDASGAVLDRVMYAAQLQAVSEGRLPDGTGNPVKFPNSSSPGAPNYVVAYSGPVLNEVMAWNRGSVVKPFGRPADWIEIHNGATSAFDLSGMSLSSERDQPGQWLFPPGTSIAAGEFLVILCDGSAPASMAAEAPMNTGRSLDRRSGAVLLFDAVGRVADFVEYGFQVQDVSIGRTGGEWKLLGAPTPGAVNSSAAALGSASQLRVNEWMAASQSGDDWFELFNSGAQPAALQNLSLTDDPSIYALTKFQFGPLSFIGAKGFVRLVADAEPNRGHDHAGFQLDADGDAILLLDASRRVIDAVYFGAQLAGVSQGRLPEGSATFESFPLTPTPDASNYLPLANAWVNEVLSHTDSPLEDAVELINPSASSVNLGGWFLSDDAANFKKFRIPDGVVLPAGGFLVFYENQLNGGIGSLVPFSFDSAAGDEFWLSQADNSGNLTGRRSGVRFGAAQNGVSFGRYLTSVGDHFVAMSQRTFGADDAGSVTEFRKGPGAPNAYPLVGPIVISEVMYHPITGEGSEATEPADEEFVELHNVTDGDAALFDPAHRTNTWRLDGGIAFAFEPDLVMGAKSFLLIVNFDPKTNTAALGAFRSKYNVPEAVPILGPFKGRLDNAGESLALVKPDAPQADTGFVPYVLVEELSFADTAPWPVAADGTGASLQRKSVQEYGNDPVNWIALAPTAGRSNGVATENRPPILAHVADRTVIAGTSLSIANSATDPDQPEQALTFALVAGPSGSSVDAATGVFSWRPAIAQAPSTNLTRVSVTDDGVPRLSASQSFTVIVTKPAAPAVSEVSFSTGQLTLRIVGASGPDYILQSSTNLEDWQVLSVTNRAVMPLDWTIQPAPVLPVQFFRLLLGP